MDMRGHNSRVAGNWIAISREMRDHPIVGMGQPVAPADPKRGSYSRYEAWQDLLMEAKWKPFQAKNKGKVVTLERGQLMASRTWLAARWNWSEKTVRTFLDKLEGEFMVRREKGQQKGNSVNVVSICNYDIYQTIGELMELTEGQRRATEGPAKGQQRASQGPESNKETLKQDYDSKPIAISSMTEACGLSLVPQLEAAAGPALANTAACPGLLILSAVNGWIEQGCSVEKDILPAIRARAARAAPGSIRSWSYFTQAVVDARATRLAPVPEGRASSAKAKSFAEQDLDRHRNFMQALEG